MNRLNQIISVSFLIITYNVTFYAIWRLVSFLSNIQSSAKIMHVMQHTKLDDDFLDITWPLITNACLIGLFIIPHSALPKLKQYFTYEFELNVLGRTIYTLITSLSLLALVHFWSPIYCKSLWAVNASDGFYWWLFVTVHFTSWIILYGGVLLVDLPELVGIKQVYYAHKGWKPPIQYKSKQLQNLYQHVRHPGLISLTIILWICPIMTLDRLLLALALTGYMIFAWRIDKKDMDYLVNQFVRKQSQLTPNNSFSTSFVQ